MTDEERKKLVKTRISRRMKSRLYELDMTQKRLAEETGITRETINSYITGRCMMTAENVVRIAEGLQCSADYLLGLNDKV